MKACVKNLGTKGSSGIEKPVRGFSQIEKGVKAGKHIKMP